MKQVDFKGGRLKKETNEIVFVFDVVLRDGKDYDGKFNMAFGLAEIEGSIHFVLLGDEDTTNPNIIGTFSTKESVKILEALISEKKYTTAINYENSAHESIHGSIMKPVMGRDIGNTYDVIQERELEEPYIEKFKQMRNHLRDNLGDNLN